MHYALAEDLDHYLSTVLATARQADDDAVAELGRAEIPHLVRAVRALLEQHEPDSRHRCAACRGRRWMFWRRPNLPCRAYLAAHRRLLVLGKGVSDQETSRPALPVVAPPTATEHPARIAAPSRGAAPIGASSAESPAAARVPDAAGVSGARGGQPAPSAGQRRGAPPAWVPPTPAPREPTASRPNLPVLRQAPAAPPTEPIPVVRADHGGRARRPRVERIAAMPRIVTPSGSR